MPIFDVGYRHWEGKLRGPALRLWSISRNGISLAWRSMILRRIILFGWMPLLYFAPVFFAIGYITDPEREISQRYDSGWYNFARGIMGPGVADRLRDAPESVRPAAWSLAFHYFFSWPQAIFTMLVVAIVGPALISQDVRSKAFLLYFSKPITLGEYVAGKAGTLLFFIALMTLFPAIVLYAVSIAFSPSAAALIQTSGTLVHILCVFLVMAVPSTLIVLCFSSMAKEPRYPQFGWIALCLFGEMAYGLLSNMSGVASSNWICCLSLRKTVSVLTESIFDVSNQVSALGVSPSIQRTLRDLDSPYSPQLCVIWLAAVSAFCLMVLVRRISAPIRL